MSLPAWSYPRTMAHRGAGTLAPENTLAALRHGHALGYRAAEVDVKCSADGVTFLLHDDALERTTNGTGRAEQLDWRALSLLDAGGWFGQSFAGEPLPTYAAV
ncbi:MAG: glycerophosphodiester phosphodiesterase family protein, partial [Casimicrobiaceae bacterium]